MSSRLVLVSSLVFGSLTLLACSDDTYVATNETATGGTGGAAGSGLQDSGWPTGGSAGAAGAAGSGGSTECTPGTKQELGTCQKCGITRRQCDADGKWGGPVCEDQKDCNPNDVTTVGCSDPCAAKVCSSSCTWGDCGLKPGAVCLYKSGTSFQCCGSGKWQYCNDATCDWYPCQSCSSCGC